MPALRNSVVDISFAATSVVIAAACGSGGALGSPAGGSTNVGSGPSARSGTSGAIPSGTVTKFPGCPELDHAGILDAVWVVGQDKGWYKEAGLDIEFVLPDPVRPDQVRG